MTTLNHTELAALWVLEGGPPGVSDIAAAIALAESGGRVDAVNHNAGGSNDNGPWQVNDVAHPEYNVGQLRTSPTYSASAAVHIYRQAGNSFSPWVTYTSGAYRQFLTGHNSPPATGQNGLGVTHNASLLGDLLHNPLTDPLGFALNQAGAGIPDPITGISDVGHFLGKLAVVFSGNFWLRVAMVLGGAVMVGYGIILTGITLGSNELGKVAKNLPSEIPIPVP